MNQHTGIAGWQTALRVQQALHEGHTIDAACLLAQWIQEQEGTPALTPEQQAHLLHGCHDLVISEPAWGDPHLWEKARACLYAALIA